MVIAGLTPREAVRAVEARLSAAGCPDADYDARELFRVAAGRDARLSDRVLTTEEAESWKPSARAVSSGNRCNTCAGSGAFWILTLPLAPVCSAPGQTLRW